MEESELIWKFLSREYPDNHQVIYLYCCGNVRSPNTALEKVMVLSKKIFSPSIPEIYLKTVVKAFLDYKRKQYSKGEIIIKPIYGQNQ